MIYHKENSFIQQNNIEEDFQSSIPINHLFSPECRICLQNSHQSEKQIRCVCSCQGSVKYVHLDCLKQWILCTIKNKNEQEIQNIQENGLRCELCKVPIFFQLQNSINFESGEKICNKMRGKKSILCLILFLLLMMGAFIGYCGWEVSQNDKLETLIQIIYVTAITTLSLIIFCTLLFLTVEFFIKLQYKIGEIKKLVQGKKENVSILTDNLPVFLQLHVQNIQ